MIKGFEMLTYEITPFEIKKVVPWLIQTLNARTINNPISNKELVRLCAHPTSPPRIRKIIHAIRILDYVPLLVANSQGYFIETDRAVIATYIMSLRQRANSISAVAAALEKQLNQKADFDQLQLFDAVGN